jgi:hypothetical protein
MSTVYVKKNFADLLSTQSKVKHHNKITADRWRSHEVLATGEACNVNYTLSHRAEISSPAAVRSLNRFLFAFGAEQTVPVGTSTT